MMILRHDDVATVHQHYDATEQPFDLMHFRGRSCMLMSLRLCRMNELRITTWLARQLAHTFDYFALPDPEYHI